MEIKILQDDFFLLEADALGLFSLSDESSLNVLAKLDPAIEQAIALKDFTGKEGQVFQVYPSRTTWKVKRLFLLGLGDPKTYSLDSLRTVVGNFARTSRKNKYAVIALADAFLPNNVSLPEQAKAIAESVHLGSYTYSDLKTDDSEKFMIKTVLLRFPNDVSESVHVGDVIGQGTNIARDLATMPGNLHPPKFFAEFTKNLFRDLDNVKVKILDEKEMEKLGMNALLSVSKGSDEKPKLIIIEYMNGSKDQKPIAYVGKGVVFDSGGISLKPSQDMHLMKGDCGGAANTIAALWIIASLNLPINVIGFAPMVENMPSGRATRPGDVVTAYNGKTIEILNTDAEGRMILADTLAYAVKNYDPAFLVDMATLTGAMIISLGNVSTGFFTNNDELAEKLLQASKRAGEKFWRLPLFKEYGEQIKSEVADIQNIGGRPAGSITAAKFLEHFVDKYPWAHIDIAGTEWSKKEHGIIPKGTTGSGTRTLVELAILESLKSTKE